MNAETLKDAKKKAATFLFAVDEAEEALKGNTCLFYGSKETAAVRRASMDLTRSLAKLRKPS